MRAKTVEFMKANDESPVVIGAVNEPDPSKPPKGARYELADGRKFNLGLATCRELPEEYPRWKL